MHFLSGKLVRLFAIKCNELTHHFHYSYYKFMNLIYVVPKIGKALAISTIFVIANLSTSYAALTTTPPPKVDATTALGAFSLTENTASAENGKTRLDVDSAHQQALFGSFDGDVDRVDPHSGVVHHSYVDMRIPGNGGLDISIIRTYTGSNRFNHLADKNNESGLGWRIDFGRISVPLPTPDSDLDPCSSTLSKAKTSKLSPMLMLPGRGRQMLAYLEVPGKTQMRTTDYTIVACHPYFNGVIVLTPDGLRYYMQQKIKSTNLQNPTSVHANEWLTTRIVDRNGNYINIVYKMDGSHEIAHVVASDNRVVNFEYFNSGTGFAKVKSIRSGDLHTSYNYDATAVHLKTVTLADNTTYQYEYYPQIQRLEWDPQQEDSLQMKSVTLPTGGIIEYKYKDYQYSDRSRNFLSMLLTRTKKYTGLSDAVWSYSFSPSDVSSNRPDSQYFDIVRETTPTAKIRYFFDNAVYPGYRWRYGLLLEKHVDASSDNKTMAIVKKEKFSYKTETVNQQDTNGDPDFKMPYAFYHTLEQDNVTHATEVTKFDAYLNPENIIETGFNGATAEITTRNIANKYLIKTDFNFDTFVSDIRKIKTSTSSTGNTLVNEYDGNGNLKSTSKNGVTTTFDYDANFFLQRVVTPDGLFHYYTDYKRGIPQEESHPEGIYISRTVDDAGNILTETNGERHTTVSTYDGLNRVRTIQQPLGALKTIKYTSNKKTVNYGNSYEITDFDGFGRPVTTNTNGVITTTGYDAIGRKNFVSNPNSDKGTIFIYDELNRLKRTQNSDDSISTIEYGKGSVTTTNERRQGSYRYDYRSYGNPSEQILMAIAAPEPSASISIGRKPNDLIETVTQDGITRRYTYYPNNYLESVTQPETGQTVFGRDAMGNMTTKTVAGGPATIFTYDGQNRLKTITYPDNTPAVTYHYYKTGKLKSAITSNNVRAFDYDENDNLKAESLSIDGLNFTTGYEYDGANALKSMTLPRSAKTIHYAPDLFGRATQISGYINKVTYWPSGQVKQIDYNNGVNVDFGQNSRLWPESLRAQKDGRTFVDSSYNYDGVGNLKSAMDRVDSNFNRIMDYDKIDRVTTANGSWGDGSIGYDGRGNITKQYLGIFGLNYEYNKESNRLASVSGYRAASFGYDRNGNIIGGFDQYTYNEASQLNCINCSAPAKKIEYRYDGQGQRVAVTKAGVTTYEIYSAAGKLLLEFTPSLNNKMVEHIYLNSKRIAQRVLNK